LLPEVEHASVEPGGVVVVDGAAPADVVVTEAVVVGGFVVDPELVVVPLVVAALTIVVEEVVEFVVSLAVVVGEAVVVADPVVEAGVLETVDEVVAVEVVKDRAAGVEARGCVDVGRGAGLVLDAPPPGQAEIERVVVELVADEPSALELVVLRFVVLEPELVGAVAATVLPGGMPE
jgi:hypothetical protein